MKTIISLITLVLLLTQVTVVTAKDKTRKQPIIDLHVHVIGVDEHGNNNWYNPPPPNIVTGKPTRKLTEYNLLHDILDVMDEYNVVKAVVSNTFHDLARARKAAPDRVLGGIFIAPEAPFNFSIDLLRARIKDGTLQMIGEVATQYYGMKLTDPFMEPYYALAAEMDVPICLHTGVASAPAEVWAAGLERTYRPDYGNPNGLEAVLNRYQNLRLCLMHAGHPYLADTITLMSSYSSVYAELSYIAYFLPLPEFHRYLRTLINAGKDFDKRIMFSTDTYMWPEAMGATVRAIESADYLTNEQKADIFCNNAQRFLRLDEKICQ